MGRIAAALRRFPASGRRIVFVHIPKCAGTSIGQAMARTVHPFSRHTLTYRAAFEAAQSAPGREITTTGLRDDLGHLQYMLAYRLAKGYRYVGGHYPVGNEVLSRYASDYRFVTVLRDPVARWKSEFIFQNTGTASIDDDFGATLSSGLGLVMGSMMGAMLVGRYPATPTEAMEAATKAAENLRFFSVVGRVEDLQQFQGDFEQKVGGKLRIAHINRTKSRFSGPQRARYDALREYLDQPDINAQIKAQCAADIALVAAAGLSG